MNLSSFAIGAFLSHAAKAHGDMGGTKHLHYRHLSSAGLLLASSFLLAPTAAQDPIDFPFNTAIGNCDENFFTPLVFTSTLGDYCAGAIVGNAPDQTWVTSNLPQAIPNLFEEMMQKANFDNDAGFTSEITIEVVSGPCSIDGIPLPALPGQQPPRFECGFTQPNPPIANDFGYIPQAFDEWGSLFEVPDYTDSRSFQRNYGICFAPQDDAEAGIETCEIKLSRTPLVTRRKEVCPDIPQNYFPNCRRVGTESTYFTAADQERDRRDCPRERVCRYSSCSTIEVCQPPPACVPGVCGEPQFSWQTFQYCTGGPRPCQPKCDSQPDPDSSNRLFQIVDDCIEIDITEIVPGDAESITAIVTIDTVDGACGNGYCELNDGNDCPDCKELILSKPIVPAELTLIPS